jgi:hypothetical protein
MVVVGGRAEGGVALTGGVVLAGSGTRVLGGCVDGVVEGLRFRIASKIAFSGILTPTDDEPLLGVRSGWVLLGGVVVAPVDERLGSYVGAVGGALVRGATCIVLAGAVEVVCALAGMLNDAQASASASVETRTGLTGQRTSASPTTESIRLEPSAQKRQESSGLHYPGVRDSPCGWRLCICAGTAGY